MTYTSMRFSPSSTPHIVKNLIVLTLSMSIGSALLNGMIRWLFSIPGPQEWFSLSWWGLTNLLLWQPLTYLFVQMDGAFGISIGFLVTLAFQMYLLWVMGSYVFESLGQTALLKIYIGSALFSGVVTIFLSKLFGSYPILAGSSSALMGLAVVWMMLNPESEILLFFLIPMKTKWLIASILGAILLIALSQLEMTHFLFYFSGAAYGYFYAFFSHDLPLPFPFMRPFEQFLKKWIPRKEGKIIDIHTGRTVKPELDDDDLFIDLMLEKIAKNGESSLSWTERRRMKKISERKAKKK